jgi:hypothetical protein
MAITSLCRLGLSSALGAAALATLLPFAPAAAATPRHVARGLAPAKVGSSNVTIADMPVARPDTTPCVVKLFSGLQFEDFNPKPFQFTPPTACPGPWAAVVLDVELSVTPGIQYDRTATIGLGGSTIFFGTTAEPSPNLGPSWHTASNLTDLSALFAASQNGQVYIGNTLCCGLSGIIKGSAQLSFYPPDKKYPAPVVPDIVVPLADSNGNPVPLDSSSNVLSASFTPPQNVERAYLDVEAQGQSTDEFWYTCFPNNLAGPLDNCGNTAFRETEVAVDSVPAGVAPVYPWIFTGGIDPYLWIPTPGVQTLNFVPYRVDLTPFAGTLDNGQQHQVGLSVFNADNYFSATANLLLYLDHNATTLTGAVDSNDLSGTPPELIAEHGTFNPDGTIDTNVHRSFAISGHVTGPHLTINTTVAQTVDFHQHQAIVNSSTEFKQVITQDTRVGAETTSTGNSPSSGTTQSAFDFPLNLDYDYVVSGNDATVTTTIRQAYAASFSSLPAHGSPQSSQVSNVVSPTDELHIVGGNLVGNSNAANTQVYRYSDSTGACYGKKVESKNNKVTKISKVPC